MPLEQFFSEGNKIAVYGSILYSPESARDLDFTLFTHGGANPFASAPQHSKEIRTFLENKYGRRNLELDFSGRRDKVDPMPRDLESLPNDDIHLDGILLTADFFPEGDFIMSHYKGLHGNNYLLEPWLKFLKHIGQFQRMGIGIDSFDKSLSLIFLATERLIKDGHQEMEPVVQEYKSRFVSLKDSYKLKQIDYFTFKNDTKQLVSDFIAKAVYLPSKKTV